MNSATGVRILQAAGDNRRAAYAAPISSALSPCRSFMAHPSCSSAATVRPRRRRATAWRCALAAASAATATSPGNCLTALSSPAARANACASGVDTVELFFAMATPARIAADSAVQATNKIRFVLIIICGHKLEPTCAVRFRPEAAAQYAPKRSFNFRVAMRARVPFLRVT